MTFLEALRQYNNLKSQLKRILLHIQELKELEGFPESKGSEGAPGSSNVSSSVERIAIKIATLQREQQELEFSIEGLRNDMCVCMDRVLDIKSKEVVELRIFVCRSWETISRKTRYSYSRVRQIFKEAIAKLENSKLYEITPMGEELRLQ